MPRNGSGIYSRAVTPPINGDTASATDFNTEMDDVGDELSDSINRNGTRAFAANQPMGGYKLTGLAAGSVNGDSVRYEQLTALSGTYQPLDADLTAIAALGYTSGSYLIKKTAADTWALIAVTAAGEALLDDANAAAQLTTLGVSAFAQTILDDADAAAVRTTIGLGTMATQASTSYAALAGATFTGDVNFGGGSDALVLSSGGYMTLKDSGGTTRGYMGFGIDGSGPENSIILRGESGILLSYGGGGGLSLTGVSTALLNGKAMLAHAGSYTSGQVTIQSGGSPSGGSDGDIVLIY